MSTNFYWTARGSTPIGVPLIRAIDTDNPIIHIGKRSSGGNFTWAQPAGAVINWCKSHPTDVEIYDEYGTDYTGAGFLEVLENCSAQHFEYIGKHFS